MNRPQGQADFSTRASGVGPLSFIYPMSVATHGQALAMADLGNSRVLIWHRWPTEAGTVPDVVLGQPNLTSNGADCGPAQLNLPGAVTFSPTGQLIVADSYNRVLIWNRMPTASFQPADVVLGQGDFNRFQYNDTDQDGAADATPSAHTASGPTGLLFHGNRLIVVQDGEGSNRVTVFEGQ